MNPSDSHAGQAVYSDFVLRMYDWYVLGLSNRLAWNCPADEVLALYNRNLGRRHLDVGVGTGYYLDRSRMPADVELELLDLNPNSLAHTARRIRRYRPISHQGDVLAPLALDAQPFDSIGMSYLLHCLPGPMAHKASAFDRLAPYLADDGVLFGATLVHRDIDRNLLAKLLMRTYNRKGIFGNRDDSPANLRAELSTRFDRVETYRRGCAILF